MHVSTDPYGRTHSVTVTDVPAHDSQVFDNLVHGEESILWFLKCVRIGKLT